MGEPLRPGQKHYAAFGRILSHALVCFSRLIERQDAVDDSFDLSIADPVEPAGEVFDIGVEGAANLLLCEEEIPDVELHLGSRHETHSNDYAPRSHGVDCFLEGGAAQAVNGDIDTTTAGP